MTLGTGLGIGTAAMLAALAATGSVRPQPAPVGSWKPAGELSVGRYAPAAVLLADGRALVAGGYSFELDRTHGSSEVFDPSSQSWRGGPPPGIDRNFALPMPQPGGGWLFVAGFRLRGGTTAATERLDAAGTRFEPGPNAGTERELFSATAMADGRFLITGGYSTRQRQTLDTAELYDPKTNQFISLGDRLRFARFGHTGVLLADGRVLIVGGKVLRTNDDVLPAELFDPGNETFTATASLRAGRDRPTAWLLPGGKQVLVAGGSAREGGTIPGRRCEVYDPGTGRFSPGPELVRDRMAHTATLLTDGRVLLAGGWSTSENRTTPQAELWDPKSGQFGPAGQQRVGRHDHVAIALKDGRVLVAGGKEAPARDGCETPLVAEVWSP
jgi:hypothetical protein